MVNLTADHGTVVANGNGTFTITPAANYSGPVTLTYGVSDGTAMTNAKQDSLPGVLNDALVTTRSGIGRGNIRGHSIARHALGLCRAQACFREDHFSGADQPHGLSEAKMVIEDWKHHYNTVRPRSSLVDKPSSPAIPAEAARTVMQ